MKKKIIVVVTIALSAVIFAVCIYFVSSLDEWKPLSPAEPDSKLVLEVKWDDDAKDGIGVPVDAWDIGFQYYYIYNNNIFISDGIKQQILHFKNNKFVKDYTSDKWLIGLLALDDTLYYFISERGIAAISIKTGKYKETKSFASPGINQDYQAYVYKDILVISKRSSENNGIIKCYSKELSDIKCPKFFIVPNKKWYYDFKYLSDSYYTYNKYLDKTEIYLYNSSNKKIGIVTNFPKQNHKYDVPGDIVATLDGVYYTVHTNNAAQIWFKPWWK